jgi:hypothetical protein
MPQNENLFGNRENHIYYNYYRQSKKADKIAGFLEKVNFAFY